jgi:acyl-coenzyme A synthetase/AMP-(fatty) acid ligase
MKMSPNARDQALVWRAGAPLTRGELAQAAAVVAGCMPSHRYAINLCDSREQFLVAFMACVFARQVQLMPAARTPAAVAELSSRYPDSHCVTDEIVARWRDSGHEVVASMHEPIDEDRSILIAFTSGSTGESQPHEKSWRGLGASFALNSAAIRDAAGLERDAPLSIVGTVPAHHMYGIELTVLLPLFAGMSVHAERPLFPADVATALATAAAPRLLVSTPLHLRALAESEVTFPPLSLVVSATAPLDGALARRVEEKLNAPLLEMFGSTETCVIATRVTARGQEWRLYDRIAIRAEPASTRVSAPWYRVDQHLQDLLEARGAHGFELRGRNSDMVEVAGKRASLADITRRICAISGVEDAVAFQPEVLAGTANRVAAVVVSRGATGKQITDELAASLDLVFVPRPLLLVDRIPRDALGKVSRERLLALTRSQGR